jgi:hypothetical protein
MYVFICLLISAVLGFELTAMKQALYHLSHTSSSPGMFKRKITSPGTGGSRL